MNSAQSSAHGNMICIGEKCKQRFKGVENFLRRVAFNLGNSPSQTEVKIISCIPIDVTDLQQKIISLEKELDEVKSSKVETGKTAETVARATVAPQLCRAPSPRGLCRMPDSDSDFQLENDCECFSRELNTSQQMETETQRNTQMTKRAKLKNALKKRGRSQFVCYAQTESGPFVSYQRQKRDASNKALDASGIGMDHAYISEMIQKQYAATPFAEEFPISSKMSSPVCRDLEPGSDQLLCKINKNDPDVCSCIQGTFYNIDNHPTNSSVDKNDPKPTCSNSNDSNNTDFYDTSLYDMVPVKEKSTKPPHTHQELTKGRLRNPENNVMHLPERNRQKYRYHPFYPNENTLYVYRAKPQYAPLFSKRKSLECIAENKIKETRVTSKDKREEVMRELESNQDKNCSFYCGNIYAKRIHAKMKQDTVGNSVPTTVTRKNAECLTNNVKDMDCQTTTCQSVQIDDELNHDDKKTEDTLTQIKDILQTVLTEVKTNTHVKKISEEKTTKDAVVQKGLSQGTMPGCSTMLNSYTYSPYNMNPPYIPPCSQQTPPCFPNMPYVSGKYLHNYPVFIQSPIRNMCSCYRNTSILTKDVKPKPATTAISTNTEPNETHKLIKEIYKSIKVNMDIPAKDTSVSECNVLKSRSPSLEVYNVQKAELNAFARSNTDLKKLAPQKSTSPYSNISNKMNSNTISLRSQIVSTDSEQFLRNKRIDSYLENLKQQNARQNVIEEEYEASSHSASGRSSDDEESGVDMQSPVGKPDKKREKKNILSKMFKGLFKSKPKKKEEEIQVENESESEESETESEGYQTVYSQETIRARHREPCPVRGALKPRINSNMFPRQLQDRGIPYTDHEFRQHWDDKLIFHENQRHCSEALRSKESDPRLTKLTYFRGYEARAAVAGAERTRRPATASIAPSHQPHVTNKGVTLRIPKKSGGSKSNAKGISWLKKHKPACAGQWKKTLLEG